MIAQAAAASEEATSIVVELIKVAPALITVAVFIVLAIVYRKQVGSILSRTTSVKALGLEFQVSASDLDKALIATSSTASRDQKSAALKRLGLIQPLLKHERVLWVDDNVASTKNERAVFERAGFSFTLAESTEQAIRELETNSFLLVITDIARTNPNDGIEMAKAIVPSRAKYVIAYTGTPQADRDRPAKLFAITNRPDELVHYVCDIVERERLVGIA